MMVCRAKNPETLAGQRHTHTLPITYVKKGIRTLQFQAGKGESKVAAQLTAMEKECMLLTLQLSLHNLSCCKVTDHILKV